MQNFSDADDDALAGPHSALLCTGLSLCGNRIPTAIVALEELGIAVLAQSSGAVTVKQSRSELHEASFFLDVRVCWCTFGCVLRQQGKDGCFQDSFVGTLNTSSLYFVVVGLAKGCFNLRNCSTSNFLLESYFHFNSM